MTVNLGGKKMAQTKPVKKFRAGAVSCAIWENDAMIGGRNVKMLKASVERRYRDASGTWKSSTSLTRTEIQDAIYCLQRAFEAITEKGSSQAEDGAEDETVA
jgi:hypothetical protein